MPEPEPLSIFDRPIDEGEEDRLDEMAWAEARAGKTVPHERVAQWVRSLATGKREAPPTG